MRRGKARARTRAARLIGKTAAVTKTGGPRRPALLRLAIAKATAPRPAQSPHVLIGIEFTSRDPTIWRAPTG
jgi:hypothetical protein